MPSGIVSVVIAKSFTAGLVLAGLLAGCASHPHGITAPDNKALPTPAAGQQSAQFFATQIRRDVQLKYLLYLPKNYYTDPTQRFPLVLFLHGAGERGTDLQKVTVHGPQKLAAAGQDLPYILVSPQCPDGQVWDDEALFKLLEQVEATWRIDPRRIHVTGLSMGGSGTWAMITKHPELFASAAPICGSGDRVRPLLYTTAQREALKSLSIRVYHGGKDSTVPLSESERMVDQFKRSGAADIQLTVYPEAGHDAWTQAYGTPAFFEWMLQQHR